MDYIITGGAGYIGGHITDSLISNGNNIIVIDDFSSGNYINSKAQTIKFDLRKKFTNFQKLNVQNPIIIHLAANPDVKSSMTDIYSHYKRDVTATLHVAELARKLDASKIIFSSTSAVYGNAKIIPTPESYGAHPISNYGLFKEMGEDIIKYYSENHGINSVVLRFANIIGGRTSHGIIANFTKNLKLKKPIEIWGDGKQKKSYIYISDLINAIAIIESNSNKGFGIFNIGNTDSCSVIDIVKIFKNYAGKDFKSKKMPSQSGDVRNMSIAIKKLKSFGWKPKYTSKEAIALAFEDLLPNTLG
jgi:UDP-glucose 4-epimerase